MLARQTVSAPSAARLPRTTAYAQRWVVGASKRSAGNRDAANRVVAKPDVAGWPQADMTVRVADVLGVLVGDGASGVGVCVSDLAQAAAHAYATRRPCARSANDNHPRAPAIRDESYVAAAPDRDGVEAGGLLRCWRDADLQPVLTDRGERSIGARPYWPERVRDPRARTPDTDPSEGSFPCVDC